MLHHKFHHTDEYPGQCAICGSPVEEHCNVDHSQDAAEEEAINN
jgi:hypothetical protein